MTTYNNIHNHMDSNGLLKEGLESLKSGRFNEAYDLLSTLITDDANATTALLQR